MKLSNGLLNTGSELQDKFGINLAVAQVHYNHMDLKIINHIWIHNILRLNSEGKKQIETNFLVNSQHVFS